MYIAIEGIDTCGKTTQINILKNKYPEFIYTKEPGGTYIGTSIREMVLNTDELDARCRMFLFLADRAEHTRKVIIPNITKTIITDRSMISGIAYSHDIGVPYHSLVDMSKLAMYDILPDIVIIPWVTKDLLEFRLGSKKLDSVEKCGVDKLLEIQNQILIACNTLNVKAHKVDASLPIMLVAEEIEKIIRELVVCTAHH